jgi:DNA-binding SARP family transcriptional activator
VDFRILGPIEITVGSARLEPGGTRQQIVVAALLLSPNKVVTLDRLLEAIYGEELPPTARAQVQSSIFSLRRTFASYSSEPVIATHPQGYVLQVESGRLDCERFEDLVGAARAAREGNSVDLAVAKYRDALRLWRGPALDGIDSPLLRAAAQRLDEQRSATHEDRLTVELDLGRHYELVGELSELVAEYPLRERLRGQLMLALYRSDRADEAREVYEQARRTMIDELGIEPGEHLQQLAHAIGASDPALELPSQPVRIGPARRTVPSLLPTDIADFTGRTQQISQIHQHLISETGEKARRAVPVVVITGKGGIGKTSLAIRASHDIASHFPDGRLFADLHAGASHPVGPMQVLERFLRAFGVPGSQIPEGLDERAEVYRNLLADRKVLVVLDDAASESQVSPLLPGNSAAAVMITSRRRLAGLAGATHIEVNVFDADRSLDLLAHIVGAERVRAEPEAAAAVADHCGHLPLALRIGGARLAARPHWRIRQLAERLADETRRLDELRHGDMGIRPSISLTYESVGEQARRLFRRLALLDLPYFSSWLSAVLIDEPLARAEDLLDDLVSAQLIEITGSGSGVDSQYRCHDLIRVFARERLAVEESAAERKAALERALGALLYLADEAHRRYYGGDYVRIQSAALRWPLPGSLVERLVRDPLEWYERERATLVSGVRQAAQAGFVELCWSLASSAVALFEGRVYLDDWQETHEIALDAARKAHDLRGQAAMLYSIGSLHMIQQRFESARRELATAAQLFEDAGDGQGVAHVTRHIAYLDRVSGRLDDATRRNEQALAIFREIGDNIAIACLLHNLAQVKLEFQRFDDAMELLSEALRLCQTAQCTRIEAQVLHRMGEVWLLSGEPARAVVTFGQTLSKTRDIGDFIGEAYALQGVGVAQVRQGKFSQARGALQRALELAGSVDERVAEARALLGLSELAFASGDPGEAVLFGQRAAGTFRGMQAPLYEAKALSLISDAYAALGDVDAADAASANAAALRAKVLGGQ